MRFWDSSALAAYFIPEAATKEVQRWFHADPEVTVWVLTRVELMSAIARRGRERPESIAELQRIQSNVISASGRWFTLAKVDQVRLIAERLVMTHPLRAADALQLGAAIVAADGDPSSLEFVTLDRRLADAALREGFPILSA